MEGPSWDHRSEITRVVGRARLFLASFAPLFLILCARCDDAWLRLVCGALFMVGIVDAFVVTRRARRKASPFVVTISRFDDAGAEVAGYLAAYLLPFVAVSDPTPRDLVGYGIFLLVALVVYVRSDLVRVNPTFYLLGFRVLSISISTGARGYLLTRRDPMVDATAQVVDVAGILMKVEHDD